MTQQAKFILIYPDMAPQEPQTYRFKNRLKLRHTCLMKLNFVNGLSKKRNSSMQSQAP